MARLRLGLLGALLLSFPAAAAPPQSGEASAAGVTVRWTYTPRQDAPDVGVLDVWTTDASGLPVRYGPGRMAAWLQRRRGDLSDAEIACADKVRMLATQGIGQRADIDLNAYRLVTLNTDATVAVINPFVALSNAKLESIVTLPGPPRNWVQVPERMQIWVLVGSPLRLVAIDMAARRIERVVALPDDPAAREMAADGQARRLLVALPGSGAVAKLDLADPHAAPALEPAPGIAGLRPAAGGVLALHRGGSVLLHREAAETRRWQAGGDPVDAAYSLLSRRVVVATAARQLVLLDPDAAAPERRITLGHAVEALAMLDEGRRALALGPGRASLVDLAAAQPPLELDTVAGADRLVLTASFAYAVSARAGRATLWSLADLRAGRAQPVEVALGRPAPDEEPAPAGLDRSVPAPSGNGLLAANPVDGLVYQYGEGMMAPIGSFSNYRRAAIGLAVADLALREVEPGHQRGVVRHVRGGLHGLVLSGVGPRFAACGTVALADLPGAAAPRAERPRAELVEVAPAPDGQTVRIRLRPAAGGAPSRGVTGLRDLTLLVFDRRGGWQRRVRMREAGAGEYSAEIAVPRPARYELLVSSVSEDLSFAEGRIGEAEIGAAR